MGTQHQQAEPLGQAQGDPPCGGQTAGSSPVDRRKQGLKRSVAVEAGSIPLATLAGRSWPNASWRARSHPR